MGAWGVLAFDNDTANDWAYELDEADDLSVVEAALDELEEAGDGYLDLDTACDALAACEVLARLLGNFGYQNAYTVNVDNWVKAHSIKPDPAILARASQAIQRILADESELRELWEEEDGTAWQHAVDDLRQRLVTKL
ncbi:MAG TPA: DUF4259 domain-containing protein [Polyangiaceae bacterium]|nr:DUF4259 domain-containing protein [Polyangiaceae bacterium]